MRARSSSTARTGAEKTGPLHPVVWSGLVWLGSGLSMPPPAGSPGRANRLRATQQARYSLSSSGKRSQSASGRRELMPVGKLHAPCSVGTTWASTGAACTRMRPGRSGQAGTLAGRTTPPHVRAHTRALRLSRHRAEYQEARIHVPIKWEWALASWHQRTAGMWSVAPGNSLATLAWAW
jgi:hypothetical protein